MKSTVLAGILFLITGAVANAQLSFLPQVGFEQSRTSLSYGDALSASNIKGNLKAALKMDYRFKGGHAPFINLATSPAPVSFAFSEAGSLLNNYQMAKNNLQFRLEAGYQYSSRPIQFKKGGSASKSKISETNNDLFDQKKTCGSVSYRSHCGGEKMRTRKPLTNSNLNMRLQPSLALAYIPSTNESLKQTASGFEYNAAAWKTAIVPAMGFEFAKGPQRLFTLSVFYTKPLGQNEETFTSSSVAKPTITRLAPTASSWGMTVGVPFSFAKANNNKVKKEKRECNRIYYRKCSKLQ